MENGKEYINLGISRLLTLVFVCVSLVIAVIGAFIPSISPKDKSLYFNWKYNLLYSTQFFAHVFNMNVVIFWINYLESGNHPLVMFVICIVISLIILVCTKTIYDRTTFLIQNRICTLGNFLGSVSTVFHVIWRTRASAIVALIFNIMAMSAVAMSWISQMAKSKLIITSINFIVNMHTIFKKLSGLYFKNLFVKQDEYKNSLTVIIVV